MVFRVKTSKGYWEERESYRDPVTGKPRSRFLRYLGRRSDDPQARMQQMIDTAERKGAEIDAMQRAKYGETGAEKQERLENEARFSQEKFLEDTAAAPVQDTAEPAEASEKEQAPDEGPGEPS